MSPVNQNTNTCLTSIKMLGDFWTLRIIDALKEGEMRYCELQRTLDNVNPVTLTNRLGKLEEAQLIQRKEKIHDKLSVAYSLTTLGKKTLPVLEAVRAFAKFAKNK